MKILTWNLERLQKNKNQLILEKLRELDADIIVLTETSSILDPGEGYSSVSTIPLPTGLNGISYKPGENRVTIWTKYPILRTRETFNSYTSVCADIDTPLGVLAVYGTIIGIFGNREASFITDLDAQLIDFERISKTGDLCIVGDLNMSFCDNYYFTKDGRQKMIRTFDRIGLKILTEGIKENIDHIVMPANLLGDIPPTPTVWNDPGIKKERLSDQKGVMVEIGSDDER